MQFLLIVVFLLSGSNSMAGWNDINSPVHYFDLQKDRSSHFVSPNELFPQTARTLYEAAPAGLHIAVGTERGFIGAALNENATGLILIDSAEQVVFYNQINLLLLKASRNRKTYLQLRRSPEDWSLLSNDNSILNKYELDVLHSEKTKSFWLMVTKTTAFEALTQNSGEYFEYRGHPFEGANYLHDDVLFGRLWTLAQNNKIAVAKVNLISKNDVDLLIASIRAKEERVGILDLSNALSPSFVFKPFGYNLVAAMVDVAASGAELIVTEKVLGLNPNVPDWSYTGFDLSSENLKTIDHYLNTYSTKDAESGARIRRISANPLKTESQSVPLRRVKIDFVRQWFRNTFYCSKAFSN